MNKITSKKYVEGVNSIYTEKPIYKKGHDGSDGTCDCIGMCRGGLKRGGATNVTNMSGTNQAARKSIQNLRKTALDPVVQVGDVVLKTRDKDNPEMPLPDKYRIGGSEYDPDIGEINFTHIGTVTSTNPLEITHMTSPTAKKDKSLKNWSYSGQLPWVEYGEDPGPEPEPVPAGYAVVTGKNVALRKGPSTSCKVITRAPTGSKVKITDPPKDWEYVTYNGKHGYMMKQYLKEG